MRFILLFSILLSISVHGQDINTVFVSMPDSLSPLLTKVNRQDFADFLASGMKAVVKNRFGGKSEMLKLTDDYLMLETTASSYEEMKLLSVNDSVNVVCVIRTYLGPAEDSKITFYSTDWKELPVSSFISLPSYIDFYMNSNDSISTMVSSDEFVRDMYIMKAELSEKNNDIVFKCNTLKTMGKEDEEKLKPYMIDSLRYVWIDGAYVKEK